MLHVHIDLHLIAMISPVYRLEQHSPCRNITKLSLQSFPATAKRIAFIYSNNENTLFDNKSFACSLI